GAQQHGGHDRGEAAADVGVEQRSPVVGGDQGGPPVAGGHEFQRGGGLGGQAQVGGGKAELDESERHLVGRCGAPPGEAGADGADGGGAQRRVGEGGVAFVPEREEVGGVAVGVAVGLVEGAGWGRPFGEFAGGSDAVAGQAGAELGPAAGSGQVEDAVGAEQVADQVADSGEVHGGVGAGLGVGVGGGVLGWIGGDESVVGEEVFVERGGVVQEREGAFAEEAGVAGVAVVVPVQAGEPGCAGGPQGEAPFGAEVVVAAVGGGVRGDQDSAAAVEALGVV